MKLSDSAQVRCMLRPPQTNCDERSEGCEPKNCDARTHAIFRLAKCFGLLLSSKSIQHIISEYLPANLYDMQSEYCW